jgi:hypothetical protein
LRPGSSAKTVTKLALVLEEVQMPIGLGEGVVDWMLPRVSWQRKAAAHLEIHTNHQLPLARLKVHPGDVPGELMPRAASNIFSVTISILPLRISHRSLPPAAADRPTALPMKEDRRGKIKSYPPATHSDFKRG